MNEKMLKTKKGKLCKFSNKKFANTSSQTHFCLFDSQLKRRSATSLMCQMERPRKSIAQREKTRSPSLFHKQAVNCICTSGYQPSDYQLWVRSRRNAKPRMWKFTLKRRRKGHNKEIITSSILHMSNRLSRQLERMWPREEQRRQFEVHQLHISIPLCQVSISHLRLLLLILSLFLSFAFNCLVINSQPWRWVALGGWQSVLLLHPFSICGGYRSWSFLLCVCEICFLFPQCSVCGTSSLPSLRFFAVYLRCCLPECVSIVRSLSPFLLTFFLSFYPSPMS